MKSNCISIKKLMFESHTLGLIWLMYHGEELFAIVCQGIHFSLSVGFKTGV